MTSHPADYQLLVLDDLKTYEKLYHPVKACLPERLLVRKVRLSDLHPNPQDEFCSEEIGPNYSIISDYQRMFVQLINIGEEPIKPFEDPLIVGKISTGGYMILNGHHRWMAAHRLGLDKIAVRIINITTEEDIISAVNRSEKDMCVSFDLDEILLTDGSTYPVHKDLPFPLSRAYKKTLRKNAGILISELRALGFDVWVYTGEYYPEAYIRTLFRLHGTKVDGIINNMRKKGSSKKMRETFAGKYRISLHVDNTGLVCVKTREKAYEMYDIDPVGQDWASEVIQRLKEHREYWHE